MINKIAGILSTRSITVPVPVSYEYFTTVLYPIVIEDNITVSAPLVQNGLLWSNPEDTTLVTLPTITNVSLIETIVYKSYNEPLASESMNVTLPTITDVTVIETIVYKSYNEPLANESINVTLPTIAGANMPVVIGYIAYNEPLADESINVTLPTIIEGTLT